METLDIRRLIEPRGAVEKGMKIAGQAPIECKRLFTYAAMLEEKAERTAVDAKYSQKSDEEITEVMKESSIMAFKADLVKKILLALLRDHFDLWEPNMNIGLRKGFEVIYYEKKPDPTPPMIFGVGGM